MHPEVAQTSSNPQHGKPKDKAIQALQEALKIYRERFEDSHPRFQTSLNELKLVSS